MAQFESLEHHAETIENEVLAIDPNEESVEITETEEVEGFEEEEEEEETEETEKA